MATQVQKLGVGLSKTRATRKELLRLVGNQDFRCGLSGVELTPELATLDHIIPVVNGGGHDVDNLQVVHSVVNRMKGMMANDEFVQWCKLIAAWNG